MTTYPTTSIWKSIELPILNELTTDARELARAHWPSFTAGSTQFSRILAYSQSAESNLKSTLPSSGILATLLTERIDPKDAPYIYNYNNYLIKRAEDETLFHSPPIRTIDPKHHSSSPSTWFDGLGSPL
jgi:hypothetical protein